MVRLKNRYMIVELSMEKRIKHKKNAPNQLCFTALDIYHGLKDEIAVNYGDFGIGAVQYGLSVCFYDEDTSIAIVRCSRDSCEVVQSCLFFLKSIKQRELKLRIVKLCGSSRTCRKAALNIVAERCALFNYQDVILTKLKESLVNIEL